MKKADKDELSRMNDYVLSHHVIPSRNRWKV
ncbi:hypothetical protein CGLO_09831 [Colletotrichum gloeosporioides Cg-14]|uniref:Uncharacterized protein n=1 Tax=Colletotrichum gloeosporioides (strain Cg-14) TaxID=1237896 RepID=T0KCN6_COLGC|nr:hypothetical protein CGLO_09831 [Colletotrichum gloeosporioides Cg-14]